MLFNKISKEQWDKHPDFRKELREIIAHPTFQVALGIVLETGLRPKPLPPGANIMEWAALMGARKEGYIESLDNFTALTEHPTEKPAVIPAWTTTKPAKPATKES